AVLLGELLFGIEGVYMADAAEHEERNDALGFGGKVGRPGSQRIDRLGILDFGCWIGEDVGKRAVRTEQIGQGPSADSAARSCQNLPPRNVLWPVMFVVSLSHSALPLKPQTIPNGILDSFHSLDR